MTKNDLKWLKMTSNYYRWYKKTKCYGRTDRRTDGPTNRAGCRVACTRLKTLKKSYLRQSCVKALFLATLTRYWATSTSGFWTPLHPGMKLMSITRWKLVADETMMSTPNKGKSRWFRIPWKEKEIDANHAMKISCRWNDDVNTK